MLFNPELLQVTRALSTCTTAYCVCVYVKQLCDKGLGVALTASDFTHTHCCQCKVKKKERERERERAHKMIEPTVTATDIST